MFKKYDGIDPTLLKYLSLITQLGLTMVSSIIIFLLIGKFFDDLLNSGKIFLLSGIVLGLVSGILSNYMILRKFYGNK